MDATPNALPRREEIAGNTCTGLVKIIAVVFMLVDHSAILFFKSSPYYTEMRLLGRIALPLFAWGCAVGCVYTRNILLYCLRVLVAGVLIQFPYMPVMNHDWTYLNIFFPLSLGIFAVAGIRLGKGILRVLVPAACLFVPLAVSALTGAYMDYSWRAVFLVVLLYLCRGDRKALSAAFFAFCIYWGASSQKITSLFGFSITEITDRVYILTDLARLQACAFLALPVMLLRPGFSFRVPKWISYLIYPAHLGILWIVKQYLG